MPRRLRLHVPGGFYHATLRGNHQQPIFRAPSDRALLDAVVGRSVDKHPSRIHAYCWMTNHLHLLVQVADEPLGQLMRDIAANYARAYQRKLETTGHLFERRYHARLVDTDAYLFQLLRYIHLNPVESGLVGSASDYPWSSHRAYAGSAAPHTWLTVDFVLGLLAGDRGEAHAAYRRVVSNAGSDAGFEAIMASDAEVVGDGNFRARVQGKPPPVQQGQSLATLVLEACQRFEIAESRLRSDSRESRVIHARAWVAHHAAIRRVASLAAVSRFLRRDRATLRYAMRLYHGELD